MITLNLGNIKDPAVAQALESLVEQLNDQVITQGQWDYIEYTVPASAIYELNHGLKFKPTDIIELHRDSTLAVVFNKNKFTPTTVYFTATGSGVIRFYVGKHKRGA